MSRQPRRSRPSWTLRARRMTLGRRPMMPRQWTYVSASARYPRLAAPPSCPCKASTNSGGGGGVFRHIP